MKQEEYMQAQFGLILASRMLAKLPLEEMLTAIDKAESLGPILDPTLYRAGASNMGKVKRLVEAAIPLKKVVNELAEELGVAFPDFKHYEVKESKPLEEFDDSPGPMVEVEGKKIPQRALDALREGRRIDVIKIVRACEELNLPGLKESKEYIEQIANLLKESEETNDKG